MTENNENTTTEENATATTISIREDLVSSAVNFLSDPKVQNSAIEKRLDFLKNKGLTQQEIDQALSRANVSPTSAPSASNSTQSQTQTQTQAQPTTPQTYANTAAPVYSPYPVVQEQYSPSWRDYFITSAVAGAIGYGLYTFCSNVLGPVLNWPSEESLAEEKGRLDTQFDKAFEAIENMRSETATVLNTVQEQTNTINQTLDSLTNATQALKSQDEARNVDVDRLSDELDQIRKLVPELFEKNQQTQTQLMDEIQQEIKSLKSLISRKATAPTTSNISTAAYLAQNIQPIDSSEDPSKQAAPVTNEVASSLPSWQSGVSSGKAHLDTQSSPATPTSRTPPALPSWQSATSTSKVLNDTQNASSAPSTPTLPSWQSAAGSSSSNQPSTSS